MKIVLSPKLILNRLSLIVLVLLLANILAQIVRFNSANKYLIGIAKLFDFNEESNFPTLFSVLLFIICAALLFIIQSSVRHTEPNFRRQWLALSLIFVFLAFDEFCLIHERIIPIMGEAYDLPSYLRYGWVIPYAVGLVFLLFFIFSFLKSLPRNSRNLFILAGFIFLSGAIGMEVIGGNHHEKYGIQNIQYVFYYTIEELLEMTGICIFLYALLNHLASLSPQSASIIVLQENQTGSDNSEFVAVKSDLSKAHESD